MTDAPDRLIEPDVQKQRDIVHRWQRVTRPPASGHHIPDNPVAYKLIDAAGDALARGEKRQALHILGLVIEDYRDTAEAKLARQALDRLHSQDTGQGRGG